MSADRAAALVAALGLAAAAVVDRGRCIGVVTRERLAPASLAEAAARLERAAAAREAADDRRTAMTALMGHGDARLWGWPP